MGQRFVQHPDAIFYRRKIPSLTGIRQTDTGRDDKGAELTAGSQFSPGTSNQSGCAISSHPRLLRRGTVRTSDSRTYI